MGGLENSGRERPGGVDMNMKEEDRAGGGRRDTMESRA